jgi:hypothetical protein
MTAPRDDPDPELDAQLAQIDPALVEYAIARDIAERRKRRAWAKQNQKDRKAERRRNRPRTPPLRNRYRDLRSGVKVTIRRPLARVEDRRFVPAALRHWRLTHDLTPEQAQARVGLSPRSCSWRHYEDGYMAPPYLMLLKIIAATGLGTNLERAVVADVDPDLRLERVHADYVADRRLRSRRRLHARLTAKS